MDDKRKPRRKAAAVVAVVLLLQLPVLFVLSIGPATWLCATQRLSIDTYYSVYSSLIRTSYRSQVTADLLQSYCNLFKPEEARRRHR
jgi:hypothetical protein